MHAHVYLFDDAVQQLSDDDACHVEQTIHAAHPQRQEDEVGTAVESDSGIVRLLAAYQVAEADGREAE